MVSANNLNLDVLELIFAHLSGNDLVSVASVSRSFYAGVVPYLYRSLFFRLNQAKRYPNLITPFAVVRSHPGLAAHVQRIEIRRVPLRHGVAVADFLSDITFALDTCANIQSFTFTSETDILSTFLKSLLSLKHLMELRLAARLTNPQAELLGRITGLRTLTLDYASWNVLDMLPTWTSTLRGTLRVLTLFNADTLNNFVLESVLLQLPGLTGLHIIGATKLDYLDILRLTGRLPLLESLAFTIWEVPRMPSDTLPSLARLRHLALDTRCAASPGAASALWEAILLTPGAPVAGAALISLALRPSARAPLPPSFVQSLARTYKSTLRRLALPNCGIPPDALSSLAKECTSLERLETHVPCRDPQSFAKALRSSRTLRTLVDLVRTIMQTVPRLRTLISESRLWTGVDGKHIVKLTLQRRSTVATTHWFLPH